MMKVRRILYGDDFLRQYQLLPAHIKRKAKKAGNIFQSNPFHSSLRLHKLSGPLKGHWSISLDMQYRIVFYVEKNGDAVFVSIGTHAIYH